MRFLFKSQRSMTTITIKYVSLALQLILVLYQCCDVLLQIERSELPTMDDCSLLLRRRYISRRSRNYYQRNDIDDTRLQYRRSRPVVDVCIKYTDVNSALAQAKKLLGYIHRPVNSLEPHHRDIDATAQLVIETTRILAKRFKLSRAEIRNGLPMIDTSKTDIWDICPANVKPLPCIVTRFRTYTAHCNHMQQSMWGASLTPFVRFMAPAYADGIDQPRVSVIDGRPLPNARLVSSVVHKDNDVQSEYLSILVMSWGQFIDHDLTLEATIRDRDEVEIPCCKVPPNLRHKYCMPLEISEFDPFYSKYGVKCIDFRRNLAGQMPGCALGPRTNINLLTAAIDGNFLYGSTEELAWRLRSGSGGLMKVWNRFSEEGLKPLLPPEVKHPEKDCIARPRHLFCFLAGDERVNEQIHLTVIHTLYVRDHNRIARELAKINPHWDDERLYQETRHIVAATIQHVTYNEFLPMVLGMDLIRSHNLTLVQEGYWNRYDPDTHMALSIAFQAAAFRFGHTHIQSRVRTYTKNHNFIDALDLRDLLRHPFNLYEPGMVDKLIGGLLNTPAQSYDPFIASEVTNHLFQEKTEHHGLDLAAINIQRGREQGLPGYNAFRQWCGLPKIHTFEELEPLLSNGTAFKYSKIYKHPDDIDLWSAGVSERRMPGTMIGPTFACILAHQFNNLLKGDRFWYENSGLPSSFTPGQLQQIRKSTQAKVICENGDDIPTTQLWVMRLPDAIHNPRMKCEDVPNIDLRFWKEDPRSGQFVI